MVTTVYLRISPGPRLIRLSICTYSAYLTDASVKGEAWHFNLFISLFLLSLEDYSSYLLCLHISANPIESTRALSAGYELSLRDLKREGRGY